MLTFGVGLYRQRVVAHRFGTTSVYDAYTAADGVSELLVTALAAGTLVYAFMPIYVELLKNKDDKQANHLASQVANTLFILAALAAGLAAFFAPTLVQSPWGIGPGFSLEQQLLTVSLLRILMLSTLIFTLSGLVTGMLHAHNHFWLPALSPSIYSGGIVFGALALAPTMGIHGLAWGAVTGALLHLLVQVPGLIYFRVRWMPVLNLGDPLLRKVLTLMAPRVLDLILARASITWLNNNLSSFLGEGRPSALVTALRVMNIPWTLIGTALGFAIFPVLASLAAQGDIAAQRRAFSGGLRAVLMFTIPAAVGLLLIGKPLIAALFEGGEFTAQSTELVYYALQFYTVALISQSMLDIVVRAFAAQKDTWTPLYVSFFTTALNIGLAIWLTRPFDQGGIEHGGPALANGVAVGVEAITGIVILHFRWKGVDARRIVVDTLKALAAAGVMAAVLLGFRSVLGASALITVAAGSTVGVVVYLGVAYVLGIKEVLTIPMSVIGRLTRRDLITTAADD